MTEKTRKIFEEFQEWYHSGSREPDEGLSKRIADALYDDEVFRRDIVDMSMFVGIYTRAFRALSGVKGENNS